MAGSAAALATVKVVAVVVVMAADSVVTAASTSCSRRTAMPHLAYKATAEPSAFKPL